LTAGSLKTKENSVKADTAPDAIHMIGINEIDITAKKEVDIKIVTPTGDGKGKKPVELTIGQDMHKNKPKAEVFSMG